MKKKPRRFAVIVIVVLGLLIAYPLSIGPAVMLLGSLPTGAYPFFLDAFYCVYDGPLGLLPMPDALSDLLYWWVDLWDVYGVMPYGA
jgi:hypothetical protein